MKWIHWFGVMIARGRRACVPARAGKPEGACKHAAVRSARRRRWLPPRLALLGFLVIGVFLACAEWAVQHSAAGVIFESVEGLPPAYVALVLGTARSLGNGRANCFYAPRLDTAAELFRLGKAVLDVALGRGPKFLGPLELVLLVERTPRADQATAAR